MSERVLIKICGIRDADTAKEAVQLGANFIGIVFHPPSKRYVPLAQAEKIAKATTMAGGSPVAIFVHQSAGEMHRICMQTEIHIVQLHGATARAQHHLLPDDYQRLYVQAFSEVANINNDERMKHLDPDRDYFLIDHPEPGQGNKFDWARLNYTFPFRWFLAGGLTPHNVQQAMQMLKPNGVDVSSGVEAQLGQKSPDLLASFINQVRGGTNAA